MTPFDSSAFITNAPPQGSLVTWNLEETTNLLYQFCPIHSQEGWDSQFHGRGSSEIRLQAPYCVFRLFQSYLWILGPYFGWTWDSKQDFIMGPTRVVV